MNILSLIVRTILCFAVLAALAVPVISAAYGLEPSGETRSRTGPPAHAKLDLENGLSAAGGSDGPLGYGEDATTSVHSSEIQESYDSLDTLDVPSTRAEVAPVTHVDLVRASQIADHKERIQLLETYLNRPIRTELRRLVFRMLVSSCRQSGDFDGSIFYGEEALVDFPYDGPVLLEVTSAFAEMEDSDLDKGIAYAERAMGSLDAAAEAMGEGGEGRIGIFVGLCWSDWGWLLFRKGETAEAERLLLMAVDRKKDPKIYNRLAKVQASARKLEEAKDSYAMALALSSGEDTAALDGLKEIVAEQGGGETDVEMIVKAKRQEIAERKKEEMRKQTKVDPTAAPHFDVTTLTGEKLSLESLRGSVVTLDFWATWCGPCRKELPVIQKISEEFKDEKVVFLAASVDADTSKVRPYVEKSGLSLPVAFAQAVGRAYGASSIPTLVLIDAAGMIRYVHTGYHPDLEEVLPLQIRELLQEL